MTKLGSVFGVVVVSLVTMLGGAAHAAFEPCVAESVCDSRAESAQQSGYNSGLSAGDAAGFSRGSAQGYSTGYAAGDAAGFSRGSAQGFNSGYDQGLQQGTNDGVGICQTDPTSCGIGVTDLLPPAAFGETEFNDNIVGADPLSLGALFWGQSYGIEDQDWFFLVSDGPNKVLTISFSVPGRDAGSSSVEDWLITVRDAVGNVYAEFKTGFIAGNPNGDDEINYPVTLGLAGTYYVVVEPDETLSYDVYNLAVNLEDSSLDSTNFLIGAYDAEREPNNNCGTANRVTSAVTLYGLINLTFDVALPQGDAFVWAQGENDWYVYDSPGDEILTVSFCEREQCTKGNWYVEVYDGAIPIEFQEPLAAFNTDLDGGTEPSIMRFGLADSGSYCMRVNHKRKFEAPCRGYAIDEDNNGLVDADENMSCGCDGGSACDIDFAAASGSQACPDGTPLDGTETQCQGTCRCIAFGNVVEVPENEVTSQYNFTLAGSRLSPDTGSTAAFQDYLQRPSFALIDEAQMAYIAFYARPGDPLGVAYWASRLAGDPRGMDALISEFARSQEANQLYGGLTNEQLLEALYAALFGRTIDAAGRAYWLDRLASGRTTVDRIMLELLQGAAGADAVIIANKLEVAKYVTAKAQTSGVSWNPDAARTVLESVSAEPETVAQAKALADQLFGFSS